MRPGLLLLAVVALAGCARVESTTRVERGPLLRTFHRSELADGGVRAKAAVTWPRLELTLTGYDVCRDLTVEEYAEEHITERSSPAAGPALSTGIANLMASAILVGVSFLVSPQPDTSTIDPRGNYGPSTRQLVQGWSVVTAGIGAPALAVGLIAMARTGEDVVAKKAELLAGQQEVECNERPAVGPVQLEGERAAVGPARKAAAGLVAFEAAELARPVDAVTFAGRAVELDEAARRTLDAFGACLRLEREPAKAPESMTEAALRARADVLRQCRPVRGEALDEQLKAVDGELDRRRAPGPSDAAPAAQSFEDALATYAPGLVLVKDAADVAKLAAPEAVTGQSARLEGVLAEGPAGRLAVVQVGGTVCFLLVPEKAPWLAELRAGTRIEAVVVVAGWQTSGTRTLPLLRAVWARPKF